MKDKSVFTLKGIAIIGVVFHHLGNRRYGSEVADSLIMIRSFFPFDILLFLAVAGWLHSLAEERKPKSMEDFLKLRSRRLILPFVVIVIVYSLFWQVIQRAGCFDLLGRIPAGFWDKLWASMPPTHGGEVAMQLNFLPFLFLVSTFTHLIFRVDGLRGLQFLCGLMLLVGFIGLSNTPNVGYTLGTLVWGTFIYSAGFILYRWRNQSLTMLATFALTLLLGCAMGPLGLSKGLPLILLAVMKRLRFETFPLLPWIGEASGTIYVYHLPFIIIPLTVLASRLPTLGLQLVGAITAGFTTVLIIAIAWHRLRTTPLRFAII